MASFCLNFKRGRKYLDVVDEIIIKYHPSENLLDFLIEHKDQRVILDIEDKKNFFDTYGVETLAAIKVNVDNPDNWVLRLPKILDNDMSLDEDEIDKLRKTNLPFFFNEYIDRWDILEGYLNLGVTDVYIVNELGFELDKVYEIAHKHDAKVRVFPNIAQSSWFLTPDLKKFFIRPEDIEDYEKYVDVFEIFEAQEPVIAETLYKVYAMDKQWFGRLEEIIGDFHADLDGRFLHPRWVERRVKCGKKCLKGSMCDMCSTIAGLGESLEKVGIIVSKPKPEKEPKSEEEILEIAKKYENKDPILSVHETLKGAAASVKSDLEKFLEEEAATPAE